MSSRTEISEPKFKVGMSPLVRLGKSVPPVRAESDGKEAQIQRSKDPGGGEGWKWRLDGVRVTR